MDEDVLVAGIASDERGIVDRIENLPGPAMRDVAELRQQSPDPGFDPFEPRPAVVGFAGLVIGAADDEVLGVAASGFEADIVIGIERVPIERVLDAVARDGDRHRVGAIRRELGVEREAVVDRRIGGDDRLRGLHRRIVGGADGDGAVLLLDRGHRRVGEQRAAALDESRRRRRADSAADERSRDWGSAGIAPLPAL